MCLKKGADVVNNMRGLEMAESIYVAARFEGHPLKELVGTYVSDKSGEPLSDWKINYHPDEVTVTGWDLSGKLKYATAFLKPLRKPSTDRQYDLLNGRLVRGVTELLSVPDYLLNNPEGVEEVWYVNHRKGFTTVQDSSGVLGHTIAVAPLVKGDK
jgi:hypothetical protein